jgi:hypothetical protein
VFSSPQVGENNQRLENGFTQDKEREIQVLMAVSMKMAVFLVFVLCSMVEVH